MEMMVRNGFNLETLKEGQALSGYISTAQTYTMNTPKGVINGTVSDVREITTPVTDDPNGPVNVTGYEIVFSPIWTKWGPKDETLLLNLDDIETATQAYVRCSVYNPKTDRDKETPRLPGQKNCFVFRFKKKDLVLTPQSFVKLFYREKKENIRDTEEDDGRRAVYGYIQSVTKVDGKSICNVKVLESYCGLFAFSDLTLDINQIYSVFQARAEISEFISRDKLHEKQREELEAQQESVETSDNEDCGESADEESSD